MPVDAASSDAPSASLREAPIVSFVATSRNDNHGGTLLRRMQLFIDGLVAQCQRHNLNAELVLVEWNPPTDRPKFREALRWPADPHPCTIRIIEVPPERHARLRYADALPLYQMIAKNVGIRRAAGRFVVATNIDILFSDEMIRLMARGDLKPGRMYRVDRWDVMHDVPAGAIEQQLAWCENHLLRVNTEDGTYHVTPDGRRAFAEEDVATSDTGVLLGPGWFPPERDDFGEVCRWVRDGAQLILEPCPAPSRVTIELEPGPGVGLSLFELEVHAGGQCLARGEIAGRQVIDYIAPPNSASTPNNFRLHRTSRLATGDARNLDFRVFQVTRAALPDCAPPGATQTFGVRRLRMDVVPADSTFVFGAGWYLPECWDGRMLRWARDAAQLKMIVPDAPSALKLDIEAGPGVDSGPFELQVCASDGRILSRAVIVARQTVWLPLSTLPPGPHALQLNVLNGGRVADFDSRILDYRIYGCEWAPVPPDADRSSAGEFAWAASNAWPEIVNPTAGIRLGAGWYGVETHEGDTFRWASNDAELIIYGVGQPRPLLLDLRPGSAVRNGPFELAVQDESGFVVDRALVTGRQLVHLSLPVDNGALRRFRLIVRGGDHPTPGDPRTLTYRVFRMAWDKAAAYPTPSPFRASTTAANGAGATTGPHTLPNAEVCADGAQLGFVGGWSRATSGPGVELTAGTGEIVLPTNTPRPAVLRLEALTLDNQLVTLAVWDDWDALLAKHSWTGRAVVTIPVSTPKARRLRVKAALGGPHDNGGEAPRLRLLRYELTQDASTLAAPRPAPGRSPQRAGDIAETDGITLLRGWSPISKIQGRRCRMVRDIADFLIHPPGGEPHILAIELGAPGTAHRVHFHDQEGRSLGRFDVSNRVTIELTPALTRQGAGAVRVVLHGSQAAELPIYSLDWRRPLDESDRSAHTDRKPIDRPTRFASPDTREITSPEFLHTHACGDFTMMDRDSWFRLRGYPELQLFSFHIDSIFCYAAHYAGIRQDILRCPARIYHIEHSVGSGWTPHGHNALFERIAAKGIPFIEDNDLWTWALQMRRFQAPIIFNLDDWGFADEVLPETRIERA